MHTQNGAVHNDRILLGNPWETTAPTWAILRWLQLLVSLLDTQVATIKEHSTTARKVKISWRLIWSLCVWVPWEILVKHPLLPKTFLPLNSHLDNCTSTLKHAKGKQPKVAHSNEVTERNISDFQFHIYHHTYKDLGSWAKVALKHFSLTVGGWGGSGRMMAVLPRHWIW